MTLLKLIVPTDEMYSSDVVLPILDYHRKISDFVSRYLSSMEKAFLNKFTEILERMYASKIPLGKERSVYSVIRSAIKTASVPFRGEPLEGLQIMGALETRALDFDRIIFLSFNEGKYPASGEKNSCIPYFLRKGFLLPTYENENSISAYNFYRLIQRASEVYMIYDTANTDSLKPHEESRFIKQLVYDFGVKPEQLNYKFPTPSSAKPYSGDIFLTDQDRQALKSFFSDLNKDCEVRRFSASSLNNYLDCQRKFYFSRIMRIKEEEELSDTVEANSFGSIFHYCMQHIYDEFLQGKPLEINSEVMNAVKKKTDDDSYLDNLILEAFCHEMKVRRIEGQNLIIKESVKKYIRQTIGADFSKANNAYSLEANELKINVEFGPELFYSCFNGSLDRLEKNSNGIPRICDYKTGSFIGVDESGLLSTLEKSDYTFSFIRHYLPSKSLSDKEFKDSLDKMFERDKNRDSSHSHYHSILFQLFVYALLYKKDQKIDSAFDFSVYQLRIIDRCGPVTIRITQDQLSAFSERLALLMKEIRSLLDADSKVRVCSNTDQCKICDFNKYCRRVKNDD